MSERLKNAAARCSKTVSMGWTLRMRSRLTQARNAAIEAASSTRPWYTRIAVLAPAGVTAAAVLGAVLWLGSPLAQHAVTVTNDRSNLEDLELVASSDEGAGGRHGHAARRY